MEAVLERALVALVGLVAMVAVGGGWWIAVRTGDPHWMNRAGALIVSVESLLLFAEFSRRMRFDRIENIYGRNNPYIGYEIFRAERRLLAFCVTMVASGELLHGFGDFLLIALGQMGH